MNSVLPDSYYLNILHFIATFWYWFSLFRPKQSRFKIFEYALLRFANKKLLLSCFNLIFEVNVRIATLLFFLLLFSPLLKTSVIMLSTLRSVALSSWCEVFSGIFRWTLLAILHLEYTVMLMLINRVDTIFSNWAEAW